MNKLNFLKSHRLTSDFFTKNTLKIASNLLGTYLVCNKNNTLKIGQIIETEAYVGEKDLASHARFGKTARNTIMWNSPGFIYVYLIYGMYHLLNITTGPKDFPAAVLIRALKPIQNIDSKTNGPGKICRALNINISDTGKNIFDNDEIFISDLGDKPKTIIRTPRVGINYAPEPWLSKPWRFISL
jgi:DNA-3-methyladenine glycosylase